MTEWTRWLVSLGQWTLTGLIAVMVWGLRRAYASGEHGASLDARFEAMEQRIAAVERGCMPRDINEERWQRQREDMARLQHELDALRGRPRDHA